MEKHSKETQTVKQPPTDTGPCDYKTCKTPWMFVTMIGQKAKRRVIKRRCLEHKNHE